MLVSPIETSNVPDYNCIEQVIYWVEAHAEAHPSLDDIAGVLALSPFRTRCLLARWAGVGPKQFLASLTAKLGKKWLAKPQSFFDSSSGEGLVWPHSHVGNVAEVTQRGRNLRGKGLTIFYGIYPTIFGDCLLALKEREIVHLSFSVNGDSEALVHDLKERWSYARFQQDRRKAKPYLGRFFSRTDNQHVLHSHLFLRGTNFQLKVWGALLAIPVGHLTTYQHIATAIGHSKAVRAVGSAVGANPVSFLIPCHRVIQSTGEIGNYRWGKVRKKAMLMWEAARCYRDTP